MILYFLRKLMLYSYAHSWVTGTYHLFVLWLKTIPRIRCRHNTSIRSCPFPLCPRLRRPRCRQGALLGAPPTKRSRSTPLRKLRRHPLPRSRWTMTRGMPWPTQMYRSPPRPSDLLMPQRPTTARRLQGPRRSSGRCTLLSGGPARLNAFPLSGAHPVLRMESSRLASLAGGRRGACHANTAVVRWKDRGSAL